MNMNKKILTFSIVLLIIVAISSAAIFFIFPYQPGQPPKTDAESSTPEGVQEVANANNKFAFGLYSQLEKSENGNVFYSPYSISAALAMTYEGAKGKTADEMKSVFHFPEYDLLRPNFAAMYNGLNKGNNAYELRTGNALWVQNDFQMLDDFKERAEKYYGGKASNLDFVNEEEKSRKTINSFIEQQTNGKIKDLIGAGMLNSMTRLVLTNAIYFKGTWEWEFDKSATHITDFKASENNIIKTQMMYMSPSKARFNYAENNELQILELPYKGDEISMLILLPAKNFESIDPLTWEKLEEWKQQMKETELDSIIIPKFEFDTKYVMNDALSALGMASAFDAGSADFSGITGKRDLYIGFVIHKAYVKVDEEGTEAAAATAVGMTTTSVKIETKIFKADHPFIFIIQERKTGNILFLGKVNDPTK